MTKTYINTIDILVRVSSSIQKRTFEKANVILSGNFLLIEQQLDDGIFNKVFDLSHISSYKITINK